MRHLIKIILFTLLAFAMLFLAACNSGGAADAAFIPPAIPTEYVGKTNPLGADAAQAGAKVFKSACESCHGSQGYGDGPASAALHPAPKNLAELQTQVSDDYLFWRISTGKVGTSMIAWDQVLTEEQIWQTVAYLRTLK